MKQWIIKNWAKIALVLVLGFVVAVNFRWGYFVLGNDNYSPEVNPAVSLKRVIESPGWRGYRVTGVASDADQADLPRVLIYSLLGKVIPGWMLGQGFVFFNLILGVWCMGLLAELLIQKTDIKLNSKIGFLIGGMGYMCNLLTVWIFYSPLVPFMVAWGVLPFLLYRITLFVLSGEVKNLWWVLLGCVLITISGIVPTIFIVEALVLGVWLLILLVWQRNKFGIIGKRVLVTGVIFLICQSYWILPFGVYVRTNSEALKESYINRMLTPEMIETEVKYNTLMNVPRFVTSWLDIKMNNGSWWFSFRGWYRENKVWNFVSFLPIILSISGGVILWKKNRFLGGGIIGLMIAGWFLIKGVNRPIGGVYTWLQTYIPMFEQVFRWQSSKIWPFLAVSMPLLMAFGVSRMIIKKNILSLIYLSVGIGLIFNALTLFSGEMIRPGNYVKIPKEYYELNKFLTNNNLEKERIYLAPEANTLYFRKYSWGFFGSSLMNYLIPNPIIEKAMTTGSEEAEMAQRIIQSAFYGKSAEVFTGALKRFNTTLVLLDNSASDAGNGYMYAPEAAQISIKENKELVKIWSQGELELYSVEENSDSAAAVMAPGHDWSKVNLTKAYLNDRREYQTTRSESGEIWPMMWKFKSVEKTGNNLILEGTYEGIQGNYQLRGSEDLENLPLSIGVSGNLVKIKPIMPIINLGENRVNFGVDSKYVEINLKKGEMASIGVEIVEIRENQNSNFEMNLKNLKSGGIKLWGNPKTKIIEIPTEGVPYWQNGLKDTLLISQLETSVSEDGNYELCIWSELKQSCIVNRGFWGEGGKTNQLKIVLPTIIVAEDKINFYAVKKDVEVKVTALKLESYQLSRGLSWESMKKVLGINDTIYHLDKGDKISVALPLLEGNNSWSMVDSLDSSGEVSNQDCFDDNKEKYESFNKVTLRDNKLEFDSQNCWGGVWAKHGLILPEGRMGLIAYKGENESGVPVDVAIKKEKGGYPFYTNRFYMRNNTQKLDYVILPEDWNSYYMNVFSQGFGPRISQNTVDWVEFEFIPKAWLNIHFVPMNSKGVIVRGINQSVSSGWKLNNQNKETALINGWEQGWVGEYEDKKVIFWPNYLAWGGYAAVGLLIMTMAVKTVRQKRN